MFSIASSLNPSNEGQSVTFTATVTSSVGGFTGMVTFYDSATTLGPGTSSGLGQWTYSTTLLEPGSHSITAVFSSTNLNFSGGSTLSALTQTVNNAIPVITSVTGPGPVALGSSASVTVNFTDTASFDTHTCTFSWGDQPVTTTTVTAPGTGNGSCTTSKIYATDGVYTVTVTVADEDGAASAPFIYEFVVVYNPSGGFVTGGGWINSPAGAYVPNPGLTGKANFGFVSKYQKGANVPSGDTQFQFQAGSLNFHSNVYQWLVVSGGMAQYKGTGTVNGAGSYGFLLTACDVEVNGSCAGQKTTDSFRIKITDSSGGLVYDNAPGSDDLNSNTTSLGGGDIVIHK